jgi:hypothetical protein
MAKNTRKGKGGKTTKETIDKIAEERQREAIEEDRRNLTDEAFEKKYGIDKDGNLINVRGKPTEH